MASYDEFKQLYDIICDDSQLNKIFVLLTKNDKYLLYSTWEDGWTLLHKCAAHGPSSIVKMLIYFGADVNNMTYCGNYTPILLAAEHNNMSCLKLLAYAGADMSAIGPCNQGLVSYLAEHDRTLKMFLSKSFDSTCSFDNKGLKVKLVGDNFKLKYKIPW